MELPDNFPAILSINGRNGGIQGLDDRLLSLSLLRHGFSVIYLHGINENDRTGNSLSHASLLGERRKLSTGRLDLYLKIESMPVFWRGNVPFHARILVLTTKIQ